MISKLNGIKSKSLFNGQEKYEVICPKCKKELDIVESLLCYNEVLYYSEYMDLCCQQTPRWIQTLLNKFFLKEINEEYRIQ